MLIRMAFKLRIYPNQAQQGVGKVNASVAEQRQGALAVQFGPARYVNNHFLQGRWEHYTEMGKALHQKLIGLERAFAKFFAGRGGYPRFESRKAKQTICYPQHVRIDETWLPKAGWVKTVFHRHLKGEIKNVAVLRTKSGRYYAAFQTEVEMAAPVWREIAGRAIVLGNFLSCIICL